MKTMQEIADALGLSRSTVSLCLSESHRSYRISAATVKRVRDYADQVGFVPNRMAGNLGKERVPSVGLIINQDSSFEKSAVALRYAMNRLHDVGRDFVIQGFIGGRLVPTVRMLKGLQIKELIMFGILDETHFQLDAPTSRGVFLPGDENKLAALLEEVNFYSVDYCFPAPRSAIGSIYRMGIDRLATRMELMQQLSAAGKGDFMCDGTAAEAQRLLDAGLLHDRSQLLGLNAVTRDEFDVGRIYAAQVLEVRRKFPVRTVLVNDDRIAVGLVESLTARGLRVPLDVQVIGFDNLVDAPYFRVPLTTIEVPVLDHTRIVLDHILDGAALPHETVSRANVIWRSSATC